MARRGCGGAFPGAGHEQWAGRLTFELRQEPVETLQVVSQAEFHIHALRFSDDANGAGPAAVVDDTQEPQVLIALAQWRGAEVVQARQIAILDHAVEGQGQQMRFHPAEQLGETVDFTMAVMLGVNHADVFDTGLLQPLDDLDLVFRDAKPAAMIVERHLTAELRRLRCDRFQA